MNSIVMWVEPFSGTCADPDGCWINLRPPLSFYSRKPVIVLPRLKKKRRKVTDAEKGETPPDQHTHQDALDEHVEDVLSKHDKFRRVMQGVWSFCKTPLGVSMSCISPGTVMLIMFLVHHSYLRLPRW